MVVHWTPDVASTTAGNPYYLSPHAASLIYANEEHFKQLPLANQLAF